MKVCSKCKNDYPAPLEDHFNRSNVKKDGFQSICRLCSNLKSSAHYQNNKQDYADNRDSRRQLLLQFTYDYLASHPCVDCGETDPIVLEFDHLRDKTAGISKMVHDVRSFSAIEAEIAKCEVRCANCHRRKTAKDFEWYKSIKVKS